MPISRLLWGCALFAWCLNADAEWFRREQAIMGTSVEVELWSDSKLQAEQLIESVMREMQRIDASMSPYRASSELSQLNVAAAKQSVQVSKELFEIVARSLYFSELSDGAFDVTFASVGHRYDYRQKIKPSDTEIRQTISLIDYHHLKLDPAAHTIHYALPGVTIDLGGIAKGYAVDRGYSLLKNAGIRHAIVTAGGDSRILGNRHGRLWMVGIKNPRGEGHVIKLPVENMAVSTSGDYERYFEADGVRYHHILNPKTGTSAKGIRSVTILGEDAITTDALSTTVFVMGIDKGLMLINRMDNLSAVIIDDTGKIYYSDDLVSGED